METSAKNNESFSKGFMALVSKLFTSGNSINGYSENGNEDGHEERNTAKQKHTPTFSVWSQSPWL